MRQDVRQSFASQFASLDKKMRQKKGTIMSLSNGRSNATNESDDQAEQTTYTTATYLPADHIMNSSDCTCEACTPKKES